MVPSCDRAERALDHHVGQALEEVEATGRRRRIGAMEQGGERVVEIGERGLRIGLDLPDRLEGRQERPPRAGDGEGDGDIGRALWAQRIQRQVGPEGRAGRPPTPTGRRRHSPTQTHRCPLSPQPQRVYIM